MDNGYEYFIPAETLTEDGVNLDLVEREGQHHARRFVWAALLAVMVVGALLLFRRRDVT